MTPVAPLDVALPVAFALFLWWFSTGIILMLDGLPRTATRWSLGIATLIAFGALWGIHRTAQIDTATAAYTGFVGALLVWGWQELAFLTGRLTGPRRHACPHGCGGVRHFIHAVEAILYHELGIIVSGIAILMITYEAPNQTAAWTFLVLWIMRVSAKLNLFLGVRNSGEEFLPAHLAYLKSFFRTRPMNLLFPVSVTAATAATVLLVEGALDPYASPATATGLLLAAALLGLAILEHWMMMLPVRVSALWDWAMRAPRRDPVAPPSTDRLSRLQVTPQPRECGRL